jgi:hypothetical protein
MSMLIFVLPFLVEPSQCSGYTRVPPLPIRCITTKDLSRSGGDQRRVLQCHLSEHSSTHNIVRCLTKSNAAILVLPVTVVRAFAVAVAVAVT